MSLHQFAFLAFGSVTLLAALMVVTVRNIVHAALSLALSFVGVAGIYVLLRAEFLAAAQVLIYLGAITVLILFGIMLTRHLTGQRPPALASHWPAAVVAAAALLAVLLHAAVRGVWPIAATAPVDSTTAVGLALVTNYVLPFELVSVILLAALVGAVVLAKDERR